MDVLLSGPLADSKLRFRITKLLLPNERSGRSFTQIQTALAQPSPLVAQGVTRAFAQGCLSLLQNEGLKASLKPHVPRATAMGAVRSGMPRWVPRAAALLLFVFVSGVAFSLIRGAVGGGRRAGGPSGEVLEEALRSTISVKCRASVASGFFVAPDRALTNAHAVCPDGETMEVVLSDGRVKVATTLARDDRLDLALLEIAGVEEPALALGDGSSLRPGDGIAAIGSPKGLDFTVSRGSVSFVGRSHQGVGFLQLDINVNPGNSGGPILDASGKVVGVLSMMIQDANGLGLALPINYAGYGSRPIWPAEGLADSSSWTEFLTHLAKQNEEDVERARQMLSGPGLLAAMVGKPGAGITAVLLQKSEFGPPGLTHFYRVSDGAGSACDLRGMGTRWERYDSRSEKLSDARIRTWVQDHSLDQDLWIGFEGILGRCDIQLVHARTEVSLKDANPMFARVLLQMTSADSGAVQPASASAEPVPATQDYQAVLAELASLETAKDDAERRLSRCTAAARQSHQYYAPPPCEPHRRAHADLQRKLEAAKRRLERRR